MSGEAFTLCLLLGTLVCLGLIWCAVRALTRVAQILEHLDAKGVWPFGPR